MKVEFIPALKTYTVPILEIYVLLSTNFVQCGPRQLWNLRLKKGDAYYTYWVYISSVSMERKVVGKDLEMSC